ncbi:MAG: GNAT family N-acetyltransferase [Methanosarcinales archaeon]|nr:MAG: GNAT family N-acetyltransferase [Methanosarcinales archaeon]
MVHRMNLENAIFRELDENDDLSAFRCSSEDLNDYFQNDVNKYNKEDMAKSYACFYNNKIVGFMSLSADTIRVKWMQANVIDGIRHNYPAIKIARLAVDINHEKNGIGSSLVYMAIGMANELSKIIGCRFVTVDSKKDSIGFYETLAFRKCLKQDKRHYTMMFLDLHIIKENLLREKTCSLSNFS